MFKAQAESPSRRKTPAEFLLPRVAGMFGQPLSDETLPTLQGGIEVSEMVSHPIDALTLVFASNEHIERTTLEENAELITRITLLRQQVMPVIERVVAEYLKNKDMKAQDIPMGELKELLLFSDAQVAGQLGELHQAVSQLFLGNLRLVSTPINKLSMVDEIENLELHLDAYELSMKLLYFVDAARGTAVATYLITWLWSALEKVRPLHGDRYPLTMHEATKYRFFYRLRDYFRDKAAAGELGGVPASDWAIAGVMRFRWHENTFQGLYSMLEKIPDEWQERVTIDDLVSLVAWLRTWKYSRGVDEYFRPTLAKEEEKFFIEKAAAIEIERQELVALWEERRVSELKKLEEARLAKAKPQPQHPKSQPQVLPVQEESQKKSGLLGLLGFKKKSKPDDKLSADQAAVSSVSPEQPQELVKPEPEFTLPSPTILIKDRNHFQLLYPEPSKAQLFAYQDLVRLEVPALTRQILEEVAATFNQKMLVQNQLISQQLNRKTYSPQLLEIVHQRPKNTPVHQVITDALLDLQVLIGLREGEYFGHQRWITDEDGVAHEVPLEDWLDWHIPDPEQEDPAIFNGFHLAELIEPICELAGLNDREKVVIRYRYTLDSETLEGPLTLEQVAKKIGVTRERARQIEAHALRKIRFKVAPSWRFFGETLLDFYDRD